MTHMRRTLLSLLTAMVLLAGASGAHGLGKQRRLSEFGQQTWQSDSGLPQSTVHAVLQTRDGFLWIGTEAGLVRFDGVNFRVYDVENTPQLRSEIINDLKEDRSGNLWIATTSGLVRENAGSFLSFGVASGLPSDSVMETYVSRDGGLLALTSAGVAVLRAGRFETVRERVDLQGMGGSFDVVEDAGGRIWMAGSREVVSMRADGSEVERFSAPEVGEIRALAVSGNGEVWIGGRGGIAIMKGAGRMRAPLQDGIPVEDVTALVADDAGGMWMGTARGLLRWGGGVVSVAGAADGLAGAAVRRLYRDREGTVWVATTRGLARVTEGRAEMVQRRPRLTGVLSIFEDREGSMWFGTDNAGLTVLREQAFSTLSEEDGLTASAVRAIYQDGSGTIWIGTNGGGLDRIEGGRVSALVSHPALSSDTVLSIAQTGADLWVGTPNGLDRVRDGTVRVFTTEEGLADDFVRSLYADRDGSLWIGTRNGLSHLEGGRFRTYSRMDGLGSDLIGAILRSRKGELWIGTLGGLSRQSGEGFQNYTTREGLGSDAVTALLEDGSGTIWIGTQDGGLSRLQNGGLRPLPPSKTGLPETVFGMLPDDQGNLWLSSRRGIYRVSVAQLNAFADAGTGPVTPRTYGVPDGMRLSEGSSGGHPAAWRMRDGSLWFATLDGATSVTPGSLAKNDVPPLTAIERVLLDDRPAELPSMNSDKELKLQPGERRLEVQYAGLSFVAPQKVRYRYKLEGFDKEWVEAGARREAFYTNLPPGRFRFLVVSSNNDGVWSTEPSGFYIRVQPTLLQTRWFYGVLAFVLAALIFAVYRWRVLTVEAQYKAVLAERGRIAREIHDTLAQGYVAISVQLEVAARLLGSSKEAALKQIEETKALVRTSLAEARSSIWNLRSQSEAETLPSLLAALTENRKSAGGPAIHLEVKGTYRPVDATYEREVLRVAQEAVANAVRHADARHVRVVLRYDSSTLQLQVIDDGRGFAGTSEDLTGSGHFGVQGMRERAARIGARLKVESKPGEGTIVDLEMDPRKMERGERF